MSQATILHQAPVLFARDLPKTISYWADKVGFRTLGVWGEPADFAIAARDGAHVMLTQVPEAREAVPHWHIKDKMLALAPDGHEIVPHWKIRDKMWNAYFWVDDARAMYDELTERGALIDYHLGEKPYGVLEFGIQDLDDQDIGFGQDLARKGA